MSPASLIVSLLIGLGAALLVLAALQARAILRLRRAIPYQRAWTVLRLLILLFALGYGATILVIFMGASEVLASLTGVIFLGGAAFVFIIVRISKLSVVRLLETTLSRDYVVNVLDAMRDAVIVVDARGLIVTANSQAFALTGYSASDLTGRRLGDLLGAQPDAASMIQGSRPREQDLSVRDGKRVPVRVSFGAATGPDGVSAVTICVLSDRRDEHRRERQLEQAVVVAESAFRARNQLAAVLVDEGLPPLAQLRVGVEHLGTDPLSETQRAGMEFLEANLSSLERVLHALVERLHGVDALGRAAHTVEPAAVLATVCEQLQASTRAVLFARQVDEGVPDHYLGRESVLVDVLQNLARYMLGSGRPSALHFGVARIPGQDDRLLFTVAAVRGPADGSERPAEASMVGRVPGAHLTLASTRLLVNAMGGKLWQSDDDPATRISFTVPIERAQASDAAGLPEGVQTPLMWLAATEGRYRAALQEAPVTRKGSVLVVDDSPPSCQILTHHLSSWGYETAIAATGEGCLQALRERRYDVVLLDMLLPDINGIEVLAALRDQGLANDAAIVMISAIEENSSIAACLELGAQDYVVKPFNPAILRARLARIHEKTQLHWQMQQQVERLAKEMGRSDGLLRMILPDRVAEELLANNSVSPRRHEEVAVLFTDIVGFTAYCETHRAEEVLIQLQALFTTIEALCERHKVLKIKTVGDALMACAGLLEPDPDAVGRCVDLGLAILEIVRHHPAGWNMRIGVHCGPVVSGVVGQRQLLYDIWGDTVNTAQRVEHHGVVGKVCLSAAARARLPSRHVATSIDTVEVKGKGPMELFTAASARSERPRTRL